ncbi:hypothetical protein [uncultured Microbacterium sp.]|uniref:hypothetical protein n=1 Tax=uncultured Microbacterium sp. TaxID=191216 RepID=UPI0028D6F543|nr:hypothetical protein [uncultured Microbacterium sp.]
MSELNEPQKSGVSRRTVTKAMAWSVPAIAVAATVPNAAASPICLTATFSGTSCKDPGNPTKGYRLQVCFTNSCNAAITVNVISVRGDTGQAPTQAVNQQIVIPANSGPVCTTEFVYCSTSSANFIEVSYSLAGAPGTVLTQNVASPPQECANTLNCP